jgi:hypothetical protein
MGNIITPTPGDLVDRQTILEIKLEHLGVEGDTGYAPKSVELLEQSPEKSVARTVLLDKTEIDVQPTLFEHAAIQERLERDWFHKLTPEQGEIYDNFNQRLRSVNKELWKLEDQIRVYRKAPDVDSPLILRRVKDTAFAIVVNNDLRANYVQQINTLWDIRIQEKIYQ